MDRIFTDIYVLSRIKNYATNLIQLPSINKTEILPSQEISMLI
jgi:hypothetical protein